jgi:hypothetical protein
MDDIKLYASKKNHILSLLTIIENFSNDIGMSFGIDKYKMQLICRGHYENLEYTGCQLRFASLITQLFCSGFFLNLKCRYFRR